MKTLKKYGKPPFSVVVVHGGPGGAGDVAPVAQQLSQTYGVLEPFQTKSTIQGQLKELKDVIQMHGTMPVILIGHSWGAWLSFLFAAQNPTLVKKLILVSSPPFNESYVANIMKTRLSRLTDKERLTREDLVKILNDPKSKNKNSVFAQLGKLISKVDSLDPLPDKNDEYEGQYDIYQKVWASASCLRKTGKLLEYGKHIYCPVIAIHGDYDPHPWEGVKVPLSKALKNFKFVLLKKCGHKPWLERLAQEMFYAALNKEL
jgi:pimeloyl-ACP methyl ester carboxylesterase